MIQTVGFNLVQRFATFFKLIPLVWTEGRSRALTPIIWEAVLPDRGPVSMGDGRVVMQTGFHSSIDSCNRTQGVRVCRI